MTDNGPVICRKGRICSLIRVHVYYFRVRIGLVGVVNSARFDNSAYRSDFWQIFNLLKKDEFCYLKMFDTASGGFRMLRGC